MSDYHINIFYSDEDAAYVADIQDLDACAALGQTAEEALNEVEKAKGLYVSGDLSSPLNQPQPLPVTWDERLVRLRTGQVRRHMRLN